MKAARWLLGKFPGPTFRRPMRPLASDDLARIRQGLEALGMECVAERAASNGHAARQPVQV
jgi:phage FluMu protein gp41